MLGNFKKKPWKNKKYLIWVKEQNSVLSGYPADDAHHILGHNLAGGVKAPDWATIPLTRAEHTLLHSSGHNAWEKIHGSQLKLLFAFWKENFTEIQHFLKD